MLRTYTARVPLEMEYISPFDTHDSSTKSEPTEIHEVFEVQDLHCEVCYNTSENDEMIISGILAEWRLPDLPDT